MKVVVFLPCVGKDIPVRFFSSYLRARTYLQNEMPCELVEYFPNYYPLSEARNDCVGKMKDGFNGFFADTSIWLDVDHELPFESLYKLLSHKEPIISAIYYLKKSPYYPIIYKKWKDIYESYINYPDTLFEVDQVGAGCVKIDREVFIDLKPPYFKYRIHSKQEERISPELLEYKIKHHICDNTEEFHFWDQVKSLGYKIMVDPSIQILHQAEVWVGQKEYKGNYGNK